MLPTQTLPPDRSAGADQPTGSLPRSPDPSGRFRVAFVGSGTGSGAIDLVEQLRLRLRFIAATVAALVGLGLLLRLVLNGRVLFEPSPDRTQQIVSMAGHLGLVTAEVWALFVLRKRPEFGLRAARWAEALVFGAVVGFTAEHQIGVLVLESEYIALHPLTHSMASALPWALIVVAYGVLIPNTWWRCALVLGAFVTAALLGTGLGFAAAPQTARVVALFCVQKLIWMGSAVAIVVYGAYRIELLRTQAELGRELGQYRLGRRIGAGGMGEVYLAEHTLLRRPCAVKLIRAERAGDPTHLLRFEREVRATAALTHPNTVQVFDYGRTGDGTFYYVMEYLPGVTLEALVQSSGPLEPGRAIHFLRQTCAALQEAHAVGLIHRDIKPGNVMVCERGGEPDVIKLLDFGLVLPVGGAGAEALTREQMLAGTPAYMSPEQASGRDALDARSDIYSLGAVAYYLLTGRAPFEGRTVMQVLAAHLYEAPRPPGAVRAGIPAELEALVLRCLAKSPEERFPTAEQLAAELETCRGSAPWAKPDAINWWRAHPALRSDPTDDAQTAPLARRPTPPETDPRA